jgi:hypothetical protein
METETKRRKGLRPPFRRCDLDAIARAERNLALALRFPYARWRRLGDDEGVRRIPDWSTLRIRPYEGPIVDVRGYTPDGEEDTGLRCTTCPVYDLAPCPDGSFQDRELAALVRELGL